MLDLEMYVPFSYLVDWIIFDVSDLLKKNILKKLMSCREFLMVYSMPYSNSTFYSIER